MKNFIAISGLLLLCACSPSMEDAEKEVVLAMDNGKSSEEVCALAHNYKDLADDKGTVEQMMKAEGYIAITC